MQINCLETLTRAFDALGCDIDSQNVFTLDSELLYFLLVSNQWRTVHKGRKTVPTLRKQKHKKYFFFIKSVFFP